ncbi:DGQHR domain-containing protein [Maridesulfovibrio sp.]|uniref:DGQHR domain-containing protein n=1 Tax=Maridesulfovibrio sp. TaxID=2795000 RepID=UPI0029F5B8FF|nr:DNA sulfur modification protein DndB [Maridesulfovibrio sp.]
MKNQGMYIPAVMGNFSNITYFSSVMPLTEIAKRVDYVQDIHFSNNLSEMIQRSLDEKRVKEICKYISDNDRDRFFNSLVLAVYNGSPKWYPANIESDILPDETKYAPSMVGILSFSGNESIIAIDGQHRLAGIKETLLANNVTDITVPVIFIAHDEDRSSLMRQRNRRLFTMLNKHAKPVNTFEIISLDEDEAPAIVTRMIVEEKNIVSEDLIAFDKSGKINNKSEYWDSNLITIEDLYYVVRELLTKVHPNKKTKNKFRTDPRPNDEQLNSYYDFAIKYFELVSNNFKSIAEIFNSTPENRKDIFSKYRSDHGGNVLFRPKGFVMLAKLVAMLKDLDLHERVALCKNIPLELTRPPYWGTLWKKEGGIQEGEEAKCRGMLLYLLAPELVSKARKQQLDKFYASIYGLDPADLVLPDSFQELYNDKEQYA